MLARKNTRSSEKEATGRSLEAGSGRRENVRTRSILAPPALLLILNRYFPARRMCKSGQPGRLVFQRPNLQKKKAIRYFDEPRNRIFRLNEVRGGAAANGLRVLRDRVEGAIFHGHFRPAHSRIVTSSRFPIRPVRKTLSRCGVRGHVRSEFVPSQLKKFQARTRACESR